MPGNLYTVDPLGTVVHEDVDSIFYCLGFLLGMAVAGRQMLYCPFAKTLYRYLLGTEQKQGAAMEDLKEIDPEYHRSLEWLLRNTVDGSNLGLTFAGERHALGAVEVSDEQVKARHDVPL